MKLFAKFNRINSWVTILIFGIGSIAFYFVLHYLLLSQLDETLKAEQLEIEGYVATYNQLPTIHNTKHQWIVFEKTTKPFTAETNKTISIYNNAEKERESIRQLQFSITAAGDHYSVTVNKSEVGNEDLLKLIIPVMIAMIGLVLLANFIINQKVVSQILKPFYSTVDRIENYHLTDQTPLQLPKDAIDEINLLNERLNNMASRIYDDYHVLKAFTENASHEMQTPLAVMRSKIEMLIQDSTLKEKELQQLLTIDDAAQKLSKLHQSLLLITKLENHQFLIKEKVDLTSIIRKKVQEIEEFLTAKDLRLNTDLEEDVRILFHSHLAEIMVSNLINNALRYSAENGVIKICLNKSHLIISNTATNGSLDEKRVFQRFYKESVRGGTGLGLAIVKQICAVAGLTLSYKYDNNEHVFTINFS